MIKKKLFSYPIRCRSPQTHYLLHIFHPKAFFSVSKFRRKYWRRIREIWQQQVAANKVAISRYLSEIAKETKANDEIPWNLRSHFT